MGLARIQAGFGRSGHPNPQGIAPASGKDGVGNKTGATGVSLGHLWPIAYRRSPAGAVDPNIDITTVCPLYSQLAGELACLPPLPAIEPGGAGCGGNHPASGGQADQGLEK